MDDDKSSALYMKGENSNFWVTSAFVANTFGFITMIACFVSPHWLQSYSRIHTPFSNLGLWEFCLNGLVYHTDIQQISYYGCWWIFSPYLSAIRVYLTPWWFIIIQVMMSVCLFLYCLSILLLVVYLFVGIAKSKLRSLASLVVLLVNSVIGCLVVTCLIIFGVNQLNPNWMPYPFQNWPGIGFGFAGLSGSAAFITAIYAYCQFYIDEKTHKDDVYEFPLVNQQGAVKETK